MTTIPAAVVALVVLSASGLVPTVGLVGLRWITVPLLPLSGSVAAAVAATGFLALGGTFMGWFVGVAVAAAGVIGVHWARRPDRRPWRVSRLRAVGPGIVYRIIGVMGMVGIVGASAWSLRGLSTATVGFDARALWLTRAGWFLQSHHQLLIKMRVPDVVLIQSAYPPLVSASTAVAWSVTGTHTMRLGVVVVALLNACVLIVAAFALVEAGRRFTLRLATPPAVGRLSVAPSVVGVVAAVLLVFVASGVTEPFLTNGYADPIWSLAGVGAVAYGLQLQEGASDRSVAFMLILVAGLSKNEGVANAVPLVVLVASRAAIGHRRGDQHRGWWHPVAVGAGVLVAVGAWPTLMKAIHARGATTTLSVTSHLWTRTTASFHGMAPYLHVLVLALPIAVAGGVVLSRVRRTGGLGNDWWAWAAMGGGLVTVGGDLVLGSGAIAPWLETTVHRVTEFDALAGWWIVAIWGVVASGAPAQTRRRSEDASSSTEPREGEPRDDKPVHDKPVDDEPVELGPV
ncbi:MAG TPA: hypothetical protein VF279_04515, partial [Acidimicrobiales bacterium]